MELVPLPLVGPFVALVPLDESSFDAFADAALSDAGIWRHIPYRVETTGDVKRIFALARRMHESRTGIHFGTRLAATGDLVGATAIRLVDPETPSVEVGSTWIVPRWQRTRVNTEAKLLQLTHCFEALGVVRVELKTDANNSRSRRAIERIGAKPEGIFRRHMRRADGTLRDSAYFSIVAEEWPAIKAALQSRLEESGAAPGSALAAGARMHALKA